MIQFKSLLLTILMVVSLTLGGALAAVQFPEKAETRPAAVSPLCILPTVFAQS